MSTTFDSNNEAGLLPLEQAPAANGKPETPPSQAATRPGFWRSTAPAVLRKEKLPPHDAWLVYWDQRPDRPTFGDPVAPSSKPLQWNQLSPNLDRATQKLLELAAVVGDVDEVAKFSKAKRNKELQAALNDWLAASKRARADVQLALGAVAAAHLLGAFGGALAADLGWRLVDALYELARHAEGWNPDLTDEEIIAQQMLAGELPLTLSYVLGEMKPLHALRSAARERLSEGLLELHNGEGLIHADHRATMQPLLACWTRCAAVAASDKQRPFHSNAMRQYHHLVRQAVRWTSPTGKILLQGDSAPWTPDFLQAALQLGGKKKDVAAARQLLGKKVCGKELDAGHKVPDAAYQCDWSKLAILRSGWGADSAAVAIDYAGERVQLEAWAEGRPLLAGAWTTETRINGATVKADDVWQETCWFSDADVDYLELTQTLDGGAQLDRQILLAHRDGFLLMIDHLRAIESGTLEHVWQVPLGSAVLFCGEGETRDALLVDGKPLARVMPLALPEWRIDPRIGELSFSGGAIRLSQKVVGQRVACPLFIDLRSKRSKEPSTWRQLTVAEALKIKSTDVAASYRVQSGGDQWVYYRSQGPRGNRTFMGQNTSSECYIARFHSPSGEVEELLEIEN